MAEKELFQEVGHLEGKRFYAPEMGRENQALLFNNIQALILLSLGNHTGETLFPDEEIFELRKAIEDGKLGNARMELTKTKIRQIEKLLPLFGTVDESIYGPLRIKLSCAILHMDTVTFEEGQENVNTTSESAGGTQDNSKDYP